MSAIREYYMVVGIGNSLHLTDGSNDIGTCGILGCKQHHRCIFCFVEHCKTLGIFGRLGKVVLVALIV